MSHAHHDARPLTPATRRMPLTPAVAGALAGVALMPALAGEGLTAGEVMGACLALVLGAAGLRHAWTRTRRRRRRLADDLFRARRLAAWRLRCALRHPLAGQRAVVRLWALTAGIVFGLALYGAWDPLVHALRECFGAHAMP